MSFRQVNLARRPFLNSRPVARAGIALWVLGGLLLLVNLVLYGSYLSTTGERRAQLSQAERELRRVDREVRELAQAPEFEGLEAYNERIAGLNDLIEQRTFPWSRLFDRIAEVQPPGVRLQRLTPSLGVESENVGGTAGSAPGGLVALALVGDARSDDQLYRFVDALYADAAFREPRLHREAVEGGGTTFSLDVFCDPEALASTEDQTELEEKGADGRPDARSTA